MASAICLFDRFADSRRRTSRSRGDSIEPRSARARRARWPCRRLATAALRVPVTVAAAGGAGRRRRRTVARGPAVPRCVSITMRASPHIRPCSVVSCKRRVASLPQRSVARARSRYNCKASRPRRNRSASGMASPQSSSAPAPLLPTHGRVGARQARPAAQRPARAVPTRGPRAAARTESSFCADDGTDVAATALGVQAHAFAETGDAQAWQAARLADARTTGRAGRVRAARPWRAPPRVPR